MLAVVEVFFPKRLAPSPLRGPAGLPAVALLIAIALAGCTGSESEPGAGGGSAACDPPSRLVDGQCRAPGVQDDGCPAGTWLTPEGDCQGAGIPAAECAEGFTPTDEPGCEPILPAEPCAPGLIALPGDTECREIMSCGTGRWGDIPVDGTTVYVDRSYDQGAGPSDGSESRPYLTVGEALAAAPDGALVAIAAGSYVEDLSIEDKSVRLWGKCPAEVELVGTGDETSTVYIRDGAEGTELAGLAIRGPAMGVIATGSEDLDLHHLWIHDNPGRGFDFEDTVGPTSVTFSDSLVEHNHVVGGLVAGVVLEIDSVVVRGTQPHPSSDQFGRGITLQDSSETGARSVVTARRLLLDQNHQLGLYVGGSDLTLDASVVRATQPQASDLANGAGISIQATLSSGARASASLQRSVIDDNHDTGLFVFGSDLEARAIAVRRTRPRASDQTEGRGVGLQDDGGTGAPSNVSLSTSLIQDNHTIGLYVAGTNLEVDATVVRGTLPEPATLDDGTGIIIQFSTETGMPSSAVLRRSLVQGNHEFGVTVAQSTAELVGVAVIDTRARAVDGLFGDGVMAASREAGTVVSLASCQIGQSARAGVSVFAAQGHVHASDLSCNVFHLSAEPDYGIAGVLTDHGGNRCSCGEQEQDCAVVSVGLSPPDPIE